MDEIEENLRTGLEDLGVKEMMVRRRMYGSRRDCIGRLNDL